VPGKTILEIPAPLQAQMLMELRQARYGHLLALHILLWCASGRTPSEIATFIFCSRSSVYRTVAAYRRGHLRCADGRRCCDIAACLHPQFAAIAARDLEVGTIGSGLVPHSLELPDAGSRVEGTPSRPCLAGESSALVARTGLGLETGATCGAR